MPDWDPEQYRRFAAERAQPFHDLLGLVEPDRFRCAVDLGCGPGELTALAAGRLDVDDMLGIDNSPAMLSKAREHESARVRFRFGDIAEWTSAADVDLVIAAASMHWLPDHAGVMRRWAAGLRQGGQLAIQVPSNAGGATHVVARELASRSPYAELFDIDGPPVDPVQAYVLEPEEYAQILHDLGFARQHVRLQVYPHVLPSTRHAVEWVRGTTLTRFEKAMPPDVFAAFVADYERELLRVLGDQEPLFFPFRRILMWGRLQ